MHVIFGLIWLNYISFILDIPTLNYEYLVYENNTLDKGIIYEEYEDGPIFILGHSGIGPAAVFNKLPDIEINSKVYLYYSDKKEEYIIDSKRTFSKNSNLTFKSNPEDLYLVTCDLQNFDIQWLISAKKV